MADELLVMTLAWDRIDLGDLLQGAGMPQLDVAHERLDRGEPQVASRRTIAAVMFDVMQERDHHVRIAQINAIPSKRHDQKLIRHLTMDEIRAVLNAPDATTRLGLRDRAMLHLCFAGGLRVSELIGLTLENVTLQPRPSILVFGKGRRERSLPLWKETARDLRAWLSVRGKPPATELFVNAQGMAMTRAGFEYILEKHAKAAAARCPTLSGRTLSPHLLRHSCAVLMLQATRDIRKVALWLGHADIRTTEIYLRMDPSEKLEAVEAVIPPALRRGRFKAPDALIASLLEKAPLPSG